ncbi:MAG TPA: alpha/beta hydrolase [Planctomycetota bacterium]|nr:alpha/beta hydrolase [Planctomycetota bacterium]
MLAAMLACHATACLTPPALVPAGPVDLESCVRHSPSGAKRVELLLEGRVLRGIFVPAGAGSPVVLHLLGSSHSVASLTLTTDFLFERLRSIGFASLALDYGGVGVSDGERDVRRLREDALAMWQEALRRADGDPKRVVLRCTSIGGIAAAELLDAGARPRAVIWIAPVSPRTALHQAVARWAGVISATLVSWAFAPISRVEPIEALERARPAVLLIGSADDSFLDAEYLKRLREFATKSGSGFSEDVGAEHEWLAASSVEPSAREAMCLLRWSAPQGTSAEPTDPAAREVWLADAALRERFQTLSRLAPGLSSEEIVAAAQLDDLELAAFLVWLRGTRKSPSASFAELAASYREFTWTSALELSSLRVFYVFAGKCSIRALRVAACDVCAWDGHSALVTTWQRGATGLTMTFQPTPEIEASLGLPARLDLRRAWLLEAFARGAGLLVSRKNRADGTYGVCYLDAQGEWIDLGPVD